MKKILAMLLALLMIVGMFAGCAETTTNPTTTKKEEPGTTTTKEKIPEELTLKILVSNEMQGNLDFHDRENFNVWPAFVKMCEDKNLTIEFQIIEKDQYANQLNMVLAGEETEMPDAVWLGSIMSDAQKVECVSEGLFYAIDDILPYSDGTFSGWMEQYPAYAARTSYTDGKLYWIGEYQTVTYYGQEVELGMGAATSVQLRLDWLDELGYTEIPNTLDEIEEYILACQAADLNQNGLPDEIFLCGLTDVTGIPFLQYYGIPKAQFALNLQTGEVANPWYHESTKEAIAKIQDWLAKGIIPEDRIGKSSGTTAYRNGNMVAAMTDYSCNNWSLTNCAVPEGKSHAILIGTIADTTVHPNFYMGHDSAPTMDNRSFAFTKNLSHPAAAAALLDIISSQAYSDLIQWGTEGESYAVINGNKVLINGAEDYGNAASTNIMIGNAIFSFGVLPCVGNIYDLLSDENLCTVDPSGRMQKVFQESMKIDVVYPNQSGAYYAVPTPEENEYLTEHEAEYLQMSGEIFVSFLTGERDLEKDWDSAIAELESYGLKDILEIYQARADRFCEKTGIGK